MRNMMLFIIGLILVMGLSVSSTNAAGLRMAPTTIEENDQAAGKLATLIEASLRAHPDGNGVLEGHPCTTPNHYLSAIRQQHPSASLGVVSELPAYLRQLQYRPGPTGSFAMSRVMQGRNNSCSLDLNGWVREFRQGANPEGAWYDPNTSELILAGDCGNVVALALPVPPVPPPPSECMEMAAYTPDGSSVVPTLRVWGSVVSGCGLVPISCNCQDDTLGAVTAAYAAPVIAGTGNILVPRALILDLNLSKLCVTTRGGDISAIILKELIVRDLAPRAKAGELVLLPRQTRIRLQPFDNVVANE